MNSKTMYTIGSHTLAVIVSFSILYLSSLHSYLLFHVIAEFFSIIISSTIFIIAWHSRKKSTNSALTYLGIAYLFIGLTDFFHTLGFKGMNIFTDYDYYANQLWVAARFIEAGSLFFFSLYYGKKKLLSYRVFFVISLIITSLFFHSIFVSKTFPICFETGKGQTPFKFYSELFIIFILSLTILTSFIQRKKYNSKIYYLIITSLIFTILSELMFTLYISNYDIVNQLGHYFKIVSFVMIYKAIIVTSLEDPLDLIFQKLKAKQNELEETIITKDRFFTIIAHDLKNPLNALLGYSKLLTTSYNDFNDTEKIEFMQILHESATGLSELLNNLLIWARSQLGQLNFILIEYDLILIIEEEIAIAQTFAKSKGVKIIEKTPEELLLKIDKNMIQTVIRNLISNAIKFTNKDGEIYITVENQISSVKLTISDNGIGMNQSQINNLFRLDHVSSRKGTSNETGTGLGLLLTRDFIRKHQGSISVTSEVNQGTSFIITLPKKINNDSDS